MRVLRRSILTILCCVSTGCNSQIRNIAPVNPPPLSVLANYRQYELQVMQVPPQVATDEPEGVKELKGLVQKRLSDIFKEWNSSPHRTGGTLVVVPEIESLRLVNSKDWIIPRLLAKPSVIILKLKLVEKESGNTIAHPEFFAKAKKGLPDEVADKQMLEQVSHQALTYVKDNLSRPIGGPTGR